MSATRNGAWQRCAWMAGIAFVVALVAETAISFGIPVNQDDSAAKIARELDEHHRRLLVIASFSVVYAAAFVVYLNGLYHRLRRDTDKSRFLATLVLVGGLLLVALHGVSDIGITGLLGANIASYSAQHGPGLAYTLYLLTFALDSVGDVFGSLFAVATGVLVLETGVLPRWLARMAILFGILLFVQGPTLGGVVTPVGLVLDGIGFVLFLVFVLVSSIVLLRRPQTAPQPAS